MKTIFIAIVFFYSALSAYGQSNQVLSLDQAIRSAVIQIQNDLQAESIIYVYRFQVPNPQYSGISDSVLKEISNLLANTEKFTVIDRSREDVINAERDYQSNNMGSMIPMEWQVTLMDMVAADTIIIGGLVDNVIDYGFYIQANRRIAGNDFAVEVITSFQARISKDDDNIINPGLAAALNLAFGLGSFRQKDRVGGAITAAIEGIGMAAFLGSFIFSDLLVHERQRISKIGSPYTELDTRDRDRIRYIGLGIYGAGAAYGIIRALTFKSSSSGESRAGSIPLNVALVSDHNGNAAMRFKYILYF